MVWGGVCWCGGVGRGVFWWAVFSWVFLGGRLCGRRGCGLVAIVLWPVCCVDFCLAVFVEPY